MTSSTSDFPFRKLRLVQTSDAPIVTRPWLLVHSIRTIFLVSILLVSIAYQIHIGNFLNVRIWLPVYGILLSNFLLNSIYLFFFDRLERQSHWNGLLFGLDSIAVTALIYFTGTGQSLFLFLYLVNLILAALVLERDGAWLLTMWTSACFSVLLVLSPEVSGQSLYFSLTVNNLAFVAVTYLGGRLSSQLTSVGSQLKEAQSDLVELHTLNDLIVTNITTGIMVISRHGFVQFINARVSEILSFENHGQMKVQEVIPELNWPWETLQEHEGEPYERREVRIHREGQVIKILEVTAARFKDVDGHLKGWLLLFDDRTDQKLMEESLHQQEKLAAVGQLAAGIAHEIRNPLASISGSVQMLMTNSGNLKDEDLKLMRIVDREIDRLNGLITEFLEYVRPEKKVTVPVDLNAVVREVWESLQFNPHLRKDVEKQLELHAQNQILGDRDKLKQAILNLIINAYQAVDKIGAPWVEVRTDDSGEWVSLTIRDNGCGIKKENLNRIFEPFHTTKPNGTGLGLAVTHKILQAHGARVLVDSTEGEGTKFVVDFPAHKFDHTEGLIPLKVMSNS